MDVHNDFLEFSEHALRSDVLDHDPAAPDLHSILAPLAEGEDIYDLIGNIPDERIGEVLGWAMQLSGELD